MMKVYESLTQLPVSVHIVTAVQFLATHTEGTEPTRPLYHNCSIMQIKTKLCMKEVILSILVDGQGRV